jgi:nucleotide-binding universal stress UspA family protein
MTVDGKGSAGRPVLLCFDGSEQSGRAIAEAAGLLNGGLALVLHAWEPISRAMMRDPQIPWPGRLVDMEPEVDAAAEQQAHELAQRGAVLARAAGFDAEPVIARADRGIWAAIERVANDRDARAIVVGSSGVSSTHPAGAGGVARALLDHGQDRPTIVVGRDRRT